VAWNVLKPWLVQRETRASAGSIELDTIDVPLVLSSVDGVAQQATPSALELMQRLSMGSALPRALPPELWQRLQSAALGEAVEWRPPPGSGYVLGCSRYSAKEGYFLLMREVSDKLGALSSRLRNRHLEATARLIAGIAHELRSSVASIVYDADFLELTGGELTRDTLRLTLKELALASRRLQFSVDSVLDHARLGPSVSVPVSLTRVLQRVQGLLRSLHGDRTPRLQVDVRAGAEWVRGNPLTVEQIFANLLCSAAESQARPSNVRVSAELEHEASTGSGSLARVRVRIENDGPGVSPGLTEAVAAPFSSARQHSLGLGLTEAKASGGALDGTLFLEPFGPGACFTVIFPTNE
jgi:signal transduction histidine kinase